MPGIAFTYEMDGQTTVHVFGQAYPIPGPDNPTDQCPFCGPSLPNNITRLMRKGYYLAVTWIDYLVGQIVGELETLGHKDDTVIAVVGDHVSTRSISLRLTTLPAYRGGLLFVQGWQLGEHNIVRPKPFFDLASRGV